MKLEVELKLSETKTIKATFDEANLQDSILQAGALLDFDGVCGMCKGTEFRLRTRIAGEKQYKYTEFVCEKCNAVRAVGLYKNVPGSYLKDWSEGFISNQG